MKKKIQSPVSMTEETYSTLVAYIGDAALSLQGILDLLQAARARKNPSVKKVSKAKR
jgi:hypothetical protein